MRSILCHTYRFYRPALRSVLKPVQRPHPPVILGGNAPDILNCVSRLGDAWPPYRTSTDEICRSRNTLCELAEPARCNPDSLQITAFGHPCQYCSRERLGETD